MIECAVTGSNLLPNGSRKLMFPGYVVRSTQTRSVSYASAIDVGPGDTFVLQIGEVHSTEVTAAHATFHLHLYGRPLRSLPCC